MNVSAKDSGSYECIASNVVGYATNSTTLHVRCKTIFCFIVVMGYLYSEVFSSSLANKSSPPEVVSLGKGVLKICSKFRGEHPCRSMISMKLLCNFIEIPLRHGCSLVNLLHIFGTLFLKNTSGGLLFDKDSW